jgi:methionine-rich copper-binding protein CopC
LSSDIEEIYHNLGRAEVRRDRDPSLALRHHRIVTCLVWALSGSSALAEAYLLSKRVTDLGTTVEDYSPERCVLLFSEWLLAEHHAVLTAMMDIENSYRVQADCFLVRSLTALIVHIQRPVGGVLTDHRRRFHRRGLSLRTCAA